MKLELSKTNRQNIEDIYPLSPMQEGMLFESLYAPDSGVYFEQITCILTGNLDVKTFEKAWQQVVARHTIFRTAFLWESLNQPVQVVYRQVNVTVETYNWRDLSTQEQQQQLEIFLDSERQQGFQISQAPLMRLHLIQLDGNTYQFIWCHHHLLLDGWSSPLVFKDLLEFYQAISHGERLSHTPTLGYRNYIAWLQQQNRDLAAEFWRQKLRGFNTPTPLTVDKPLSMREQHSGYGEQQIELTVPATAAVVSFVRQHQLTMSNLVQATWGLLLSRYSQETDVVFGATVSGRPPELAGVESIVGLFINTLPVRVQISEQTELLGLLKDLQAQQIESEQFSYSSLVEIQGLSDVPRGTSLFESIVVFENYPVDADVLQGNKDFSLSNFRWIEQTNYPLTVLVSPGEQLSLRVMYDASRFEDGTISRMLGHFRTMLEAIATNPQQQISQLPILTKSEQQQLLVDWNDTQVDYPQDKCIYKLFEAQVELTPNAVAVVFENQQLTYHELNCRANQLAHYLQSLGVKPDVLVGICVERSLEMLIGILGILKAGGAYVPLDSAYPQDRLRFMLEDAAVSVLLTQQQLVEKLPEHQARVIYLDTDWQLISQLNQDNLIPGVQENNLGYVIYTSGSTGQPKGVAMNQLALCNLILWQLQNSPISPSGVKTLQFAPVSFDVSFQEMFSTWCSGGTLLLIGEELRREPLALLGLLQEQAIERLFVPFVALQQLAEVAVSSELVTSNLREIITAGEQLQITPAISKWLSQLSDCTLHNHYGPSESHVIVTFTLTNSVDTWSLLPPIGRPIANTQIYILDKYLQPVPLGTPGELHIGGVSLARGYLNRPELTEEKFIPNPFGRSRGAEEQRSRGGERLYKTGDLARYLPDGNIEYLGRIDRQVKIRGFRIELGEIEAVLSQYKHIQASCAIAREDTPGDKRLVAYIVPQPEQTCTERSRSTPTVSVLRQFLKSKLPEYMVPSAIVILESLPLTPNGKVDRRALPAPEPSSELLEKYVAPRTPIEEILALIWQQVLKVELVGRHDNFFELGGHSLLATQLISRVRTSLKVELPLRSLFATPTVAELASSIQQLQQQNIELSTPPIFPRAENAEIPLSFAQQRLWFLDQLEPNSALYNIHFGLRLAGILNVAALQQSLLEIIHRHEALRTNFITVDGQAAQIIQTQPNWTVPVVDLQHLSITEQKTAAQKLVQQQGIQPFDLAEEALIRATLVLLSETEHWLLVCMHHVVSDGWSMGVFVEELIALYNAYFQGQPSPLLPLPIQYADFAIWQRQWLQGSVLNSQLSYWEEQLANASTFLPLPTDRPRPAVQTFNGANMEFALSVELTQQLTKLSQEQGVTLFMTLLAAYNILLYRYTGQTDILVGTPIANRDRTELEGLIGFFVNTLVMRTEISGDRTFNELLPRIRETALSAYTHQDLPFEMLVEALQPERDMSHTPLFQVMFVLQNAPVSEFELTGLSVSLLPVESSTAKFDMTLVMENTADGLVGWWEYNTDLFDSSTIERMMGHFVSLVEGIVANPNERISQLPLLAATEKQQLLVDWNDTAVDYPFDKCIHQLFEEQVERTPNAVAVVFENERLTYHELNYRANQLANYLQTLGVKPDVLVGICVERSLEMVVGLLGILKAGGAYVPLDPEYPIERLSFMLEDAAVPVLLTQQRLLEKLPQHQAQVVCLDTHWHSISGFSQDDALAQLTVGIASVKATNLAYVIYTSGSTGKPKGAMNAHLGICNRLLWMQQAYQLTALDCVLQKTPFSFDVSVWEFFWPLFTGARLVLAKPGGHKDSVYLVNLIEQQQVTTLHFVPSMLQAFLEEQSVKNCHSLKRVICSGEALPKELQERFFERLKCELHNLYGPTEAAIDVTYWQCQLDSNLRTVPIGRPIANTQIYILDSHLQPVPIGVPGELHIGGVGLARGYLNRSELTQEKFIPNPFDKSKLKSRKSKLYKTGDKVRYLPDGNIEYLGRIDNQVKLRGFRIELGEIEAVLSQHSQVQSCCVILREDSPGDKRLVAYVVAHQDSIPTIGELRQFVKAKLPEYAIPNAFVILESLPLTPNGKVDRRALRVPDLYSNWDKYIAPRTPNEELLAQTWAQVLKVEQVGIYDNFFELGGHSLLATQLVSRIRNIFKVELPLREFFARATVTELADLIEQLQQQNLELTAPPILKRAEDSQLSLSYAQQRLWFLDQFEPNSSFYNIPMGLRLVGSVNVVALEQSLIEIIHRHEALRTNFVTVNGQATQFIRESGSENREQRIISIVDLQHLPITEKEITAQKLVQQQAIEPFDLANDALIRATLLVLSPTEQRLSVCMHHVVSDGWSIGVFVQELAALYNAYSQGESSPLTPLPIQYADFALWQRNWLQGEVLQNQLSYWEQQLKDAPVLLSLPTDRPRPAVQTYNGAYQEFALTGELTSKLTKFSQEQGVTLFMTLLAAYNTLLYRYTGQTDILVGSPIANRDRTELEGLIGFFVNTLVMRTEVLGDRTFNELLTHVREMALSAYAHQDLPFEMLVEALQPERDMSHTPLFQVMFVLQNTPMSEIELTGLTVSSLPIESSTAKFDLTLIMENTATGLVGWWEYNTDLFNSSTIERMTGHFVTMLEAIVANPQEQISKLPILTESEQRQLLVEWNDTWVDYPQDKCIHQLFEEQVERTPDAVAVAFENQQLTYHELNCRANQLAHYLQSLGVKPDTLVGICVERSLEMLVGILGILKAGGVYVPLDPEYPQERLNFMLENAQVSLLLTQEKLVESLVQHQVRLVSLDSNWQSISLANQDNLNSTVSPENLCYVIYTSGSTGTPKGVAVTHQAVNRLVFNTNYVQLSPSDRVAQAANIAFDAATFEIWGALLHGAKLVIINKSVLLTPKEFAANMRFHEVSVLFLTTALFNQLANFVPQAFSSLRYLLFGGEAVDPRWVQEVLEKGAPQQLLHVYGPTENTTFSSWYLVKDLPTTATTIPIGRPISNTQIYIFDQNLQPVPVGVPGELYIGGVGLAQGYFNARELTQEKFIPNPFGGRRGAGEQRSKGGERLYKTGDLARYLPDGNIEYLVRIDNQVKIRGFRIELGEIEVVLSQHEDVQVCCVIAREDNPGDKRLVAYIVPQSQMTPKISVLRSFLKEKLSEYMIPSAFVILESLPLTPNGKIDRRALPAPETSSELSEKYVAPRSPIEEILSLIWTQVLKVELVGRHDNFFELGGHSLLATQLISRIRTNFQVEIPLRSLFAAPTIAQLALNIQRLQQQDLELSAPPILSRAENAEIPLSYAQQRLWFLDQLEPNSASYNIPIGLRLVGTLEVTALEQSLIEIIHRHEALRTNFVTIDGQAAQIIQTQPNWTFSVVDLQHLSTTEIELVAVQLVQQQAIQPFNLAEETLFRATLLVLSETEHWLLVCMHHIVSDGWSIGVFVHELQALYNAYSQDQPSPLLPLPIQYADFAIWQKQWLQGSVLNSQLSYWQEQLASAPTFLPLPTDRPRPAVQTFNGANLEFALSAELTQQLTKLSQEQGVTLFMTLLAAYNTLLYRYTGQEDILVGTPIANRDRTELEGLIGFFVNTLVMRTDLSENPSFNELLPRLREMALSAYAHQDLPFEMLVEALQPERDMSHTPLFQVMFVLQNTPISEIELTGLTVSSLPIESSTAKFDLTLSMENTLTGLVGVWEYNTNLFDSCTIERMTGHFVTLLEGIVANPSERISQLPMLTAFEQQQLLVKWNDTQVDYPIDKCIHQLFEEQVERTPDAVAVVFENQQLTYHELNCRANQLAHYLQSLGVRPDTLVAICVERSLEMVVGLLGILKAGAAYVPLDPAYPQDRLSFMLENAQASVLLTQQQLVEKFQKHQAQVVCLDTDWHFISQLNQDNLITKVQATNLAYVIYTSGSTGTPKGVLIAHQGLLNLVLWHQRTFKITTLDKATQLAGTGFDAAAWELWPYLTAGASIYLVKSDILASPVNLRDWLISQKITISFVPTPVTQELLSLEWTTESLALRYILTGGDKLNQYPPASVPFQVVNNYGPTENTVVTTSGLVVAKDQEQISPSIGRPIDNTHIYILDKYLQPVPIGVPGELHIGGAGLARGYLNRPELTQEKFIPNPFEKAEGRWSLSVAEVRQIAFSISPWEKVGGSKLYKTGDLARYLPDGNIEYLGRIDNQIKIRGFRIELGEIEAILSQHPGVRENAVVAREDIPGEKRLIAYFVPQLEQTPTINELRIFLKEKLPQYMVPSAFVRLEFLPLTPNGKVDRKALPIPDSHNTQAVSFVAPRTSVEKVLADIWANVLHLKQVGVLDNFFELGGHSLSTIRVMSQVNETFQINLPLRHLFTAPTVAELAQTIEFTSGADSTVTANKITTVDLQAEVVLDQTINPSNLVYQPVSEPSAIFLTGATGFVGAFLLAELLQQTQADIYCLVRAANFTAGKQRLQETLKSYLLWEASFNSRIIPVLGDLSQPLLGLSDEQFHLMARKIDLIYHNGALVNHVYPYALLKAANIRGTEEVLKLASQIKIKPVHFISTVSVFASDEYFKLEVVQENDPLESCQGLPGGYAQSKWVAEKMVMMARDRGLPCSIYRLGRITWHSQTGVWNSNDMFYRFIKSCIQLKSAPEMNSMVEITPVDYLTKALIHLSQQPESLGKAFHLINSDSAPWSQFINCIRSLGYPLQQLSYEDWQAELLRSTQISTDNALYSVVSLAGDNTSSESNATSSLKFDCQNTLNGLVNTDIRWPEVDNKLLQAFFTNL
ncbi:non-ribosomal peptide synthase/polyketide synthase [Nostoc sp.]|uniref:non-ribosomal peptide synthase/polyketide synthase n=1 Tax=Nostoc sp. TaxID=1180 RepID=UPI002FFD06F6